MIKELPKRNCPYCSEEILAGAKKCKHCGEWVDNEVFGHKDKISKNRSKSQQKSAKKKKIFIIISLLILIVLIGSGVGYYYYYWKNNRDKEIRTYNRNFEDSYQKVTSMQYGYGSGLGDLLGNQCSLDERVALEDKLNSYNRSSNKAEVASSVDRFTTCIRNNISSSFDKENNLIAELSGKIEGLQTAQQKDLAQQLVSKSQDFVKAKQDYNTIWNNYYFKQIEWASAIGNYVSGSISLAERNQAVDAVNKANTDKTTQIGSIDSRIDSIQAERTNIYSRLMSILPR